MSEEDDAIVYTRRTKTLHYGSLEEKEKQRLATGDQSSGSLASDALQAGIASGNINVTQGNHIIR